MSLLRPAHGGRILVRNAAPIAWRVGWADAPQISAELLGAQKTKRRPEQSGRRQLYRTET